MLRITDAGFQLSEYIPLTFIQELNSGKSCPLLVRSVCEQTSTKDDIVVKLSDHIMSNDAKCREIIASFIANELNIRVAEPMLVHINQPIIDTFKDKPELFKRVSDAVGINFGCKWAGNGYNEFVNDTELPPNLFDDALNIFIFDILILNADRRPSKQNLKQNGENIVIFDHESAFGFVFDILPNKSPWILTEHDKEWIKGHLFYKNIRKNYNRFDVNKKINNFTSLIPKLNDFFWERVKEFVPSEWQNGHQQIAKIEAYLSKINQNIEKFQDQIIEILQ